jgi:hypothetical protein
MGLGAGVLLRCIGARAAAEGRELLNGCCLATA